LDRLSAREPVEQPTNGHFGLWLADAQAYANADVRLVPLRTRPGAPRGVAFGYGSKRNADHVAA
jgi:hypothetical protein